MLRTSCEVKVCLSDVSSLIVGIALGLPILALSMCFGCPVAEYFYGLLLGGRAAWALLLLVLLLLPRGFFARSLIPC